MPRTVKAYDVRRQEILDVARRHFADKGYENTSVRAIIEEIGIAKGTFYHYFPSKLAVIDALVDGILEESLGSMEPLVDAPGLTSLDKLRALFDDMMHWKAEHDPFFSSVWTRNPSEHNTLLRQKMGVAWSERLMPMARAMIEEGIDIGLFDTSDPAEIGVVLWRFLSALRDVGFRLLRPEEINATDRLDEIDKLCVRWRTSSFCIERILGLPDGRLDMLQAKCMIGLDGKLRERLQ
jgi:TetR/AcrR family transcriptional regulator, cholesterol catabolism regulator